MPYCSATRGLMATNHVILNHGQVTWTTPELATISPNYHTKGRTLQLSTELTCIAALHGGSLVVLVLRCSSVDKQSNFSWEWKPTHIKNLASDWSLIAVLEGPAGSSSSILTLPPEIPCAFQTQPWAMIGPLKKARWISLIWSDGPVRWDAIGYSSQMPLVLNGSTFISSRYIFDVLMPVALPFLQAL
ncbi:hypothetical protein TNCV_2268251 [Trichonephila clavipes]|nr:hypothetical protein TNCV_2268251 [Trichonephila clavipes]